MYMEISMGGSQKTSTLGYIHKRFMSAYHGDTCISVLILVAFIIVKLWNKQQMSRERNCSIYATEFFSTIKNNEMILLGGKFIHPYAHTHTCTYTYTYVHIHTYIYRGLHSILKIILSQRFLNF